MLFLFSSLIFVFLECPSFLHFHSRRKSYLLFKFYLKHYLYYEAIIYLKDIIFLLQNTVEVHLDLHNAWLIVDPYLMKLIKMSPILVPVSSLNV